MFGGRILGAVSACTLMVACTTRAGDPPVAEGTAPEGTAPEGTASEGDDDDDEH